MAGGTAVIFDVPVQGVCLGGCVLAAGRGDLSSIWECMRREDTGPEISLRYRCGNGGP